MSATRYKYFLEAWNEDFKHNQKTLPNKPLKEIFQNDDDLTYEIPLRFKYRPDLISLMFYKDPKLFWILVYANEFYNTPEDFEVGVKLRVPRYERILNIL